MGRETATLLVDWDHLTETVADWQNRGWVRIHLDDQGAKVELIFVRHVDRCD